MRERRVVISGGGTGGHLYPALVLGRKLRDRDPALRLLYIGSRREVERRIMAEHDVPYVGLPVEGLKGRGLRALRGLVLLPAAFLKAFATLVRFRPGLAVGVGGFSSGPVVLLAAWLGLPTLIMEQNVRPGYTNRRLARRAGKAVVAFEATLAAFGDKGVRLGNPVRPEFYTLAPHPRERRLGVLVFGGSQGSRFLNERVAAALPLLAARRDELALVHQTGEKDAAEVRARYEAAGFGEAHVAPYLPDMPARFREADLVLCRAGATTIAELIAARRAALLVPFAGAADDHQTANAAELARFGGAEVLPEAEASPERLAGRILHYLEARDELDAMARALAPLATPDAADRIADLCLELLDSGIRGDAK
jgi:UDP-N-acetylglucosamine--N-acetylmuramyl-(pentapeptide) pyrophosphoryl-undecaprenol N-acetylglucosamine transferase